jgi:transposase InsO family protein
MDKYIIERRARERMAWFKRFEKVGCVAEVCRHFQISRKTFYKWWGPYCKEGLGGLRDRSKKPRSHPRTVPWETGKLILELRRKSRYGPRRLAFYLKRDYGVTISPFGVYKVLLRAGEIKPRHRRPRKKPVYYSLARPGERVQVDVKYLPKLKIGRFPEGYQEYQYTAIDDCTRLRFTGIYQEVTPQNSVDFMKRALSFFPFPIQEVQTDHGVEFTYIFFPHVQKSHPFDVLLKSEGIHHKLIPIAKPEHNGKVERSHRTDDEELYNLRDYRSPRRRAKAVAHYLRYYNNQRPHSALAWLTPLQKLQSFPEFQGVTHV